MILSGPGRCLGNRVALPRGRPVHGRWYYAFVSLLFLPVALRLILRAPSASAAVVTGSVTPWLLIAFAIVADTPLVRASGLGGLPVKASITFCCAISYYVGHGVGLSTQALAIVVAGVFCWRSSMPKLKLIPRTARSC